MLKKKKRTHIKAKDINSQHGCLKTTQIINFLLTKNPYIVRKCSPRRKKGDKVGHREHTETIWRSGTLDC